MLPTDAVLVQEIHSISPTFADLIVAYCELIAFVKEHVDLSPTLKQQRFVALRVSKKLNLCCYPQHIHFS